ncbi:plakophilin-3-like [Hemitrygon akajei]|uniref:plakophilin-3-like n=1 Tax=Hemitrygon akajei TaxID=2704970 RepID=UPI003BF955B8
MQEAHFLKSALPSDAPVSTLAVPPESQLDQRNKYRLGTEQKSIRVQEQVLTMLKNSSGRATGSSYAGSVLEGSGGMTKYQAATMPGFSSKSQVYLTEKKYSTVKPSVYQQGGNRNWSSRSAVGDFAFKGPSRASQYSRRGEEVISQTRSFSSHHHSKPRPLSFHRSSQYAYGTASQMGQQDIDSVSLRSLQLPSKYAQKSSWSGSQGNVAYQRQDDEEISMISDQVDNGYMSGGNEYTSSANYTIPYPLSHQMSGGVSVKRLSSGSIGMPGYVAEERETSIRRTVRPPAQRTLQRVQQNCKSMRGRASISSQHSIQIPRTPSLHSLSGRELGDQQMQQLQSEMSRFQMSQNDGMNLPTAVQFLGSHDVNNQVIGAGYIQHTCYHDANAKTQAYNLNAIVLLVNLFNHDAVEVQRSATAAMRNLIYNNNINKLELVKQNGIPNMMQAIRVADEELKANITGILWNLSSNEDLKDTLAQGTLDDVTEEIISPYSGWSKNINVHQLASEDSVFYNTTGYIRNLSSGKVETRQKMRQCKGLVDSLVYYIQHCLDVDKTSDKSLENSTCVLRNLSYRLYEEIPTYYQSRLEGPGRNDRSAKNGDVVGCFTPQSRKAKEVNMDTAIFSEVSKNPKGIEWLWNPTIVKMYSKLLENSQHSQQTTEAALGALQNITAGDGRWASVVSRMTMDQDRTWFTLIDLLKNSNDNILKALTGLLRNLAIHAKNKEDVSIKIIGPLLNKLPEDINFSSTTDEVAANICTILNSLVVETVEAPKQIVNHNGLRKIINIKERGDSESEKAVKAASSLLGNMWYYKSMHRAYRSKGFLKNNFVPY